MLWDSRAPCTREFCSILWPVLITHKRLSVDEGSRVRASALPSPAAPHSPRPLAPLLPRSPAPPHPAHPLSCPELYALRATNHRMRRSFYTFHKKSTNPDTPSPFRDHYTGRRPQTAVVGQRGTISGAGGSGNNGPRDVRDDFWTSVRSFCCQSWIV